MEACYVFSVVLFTSKELVTIYFKCIGFETPEVLCGLKHFTHPSISIMSEFSFFYPFNLRAHLEASSELVIKPHPVQGISELIQLHEIVEV